MWPGRQVHSWFYREEKISGGSGHNRQLKSAKSTAEEWKKIDSCAVVGRSGTHDLSRIQLFAHHHLKSQQLWRECASNKQESGRPCGWPCHSFLCLPPSWARNPACWHPPLLRQVCSRCLRPNSSDQFCSWLPGSSLFDECGKCRRCSAAWCAALRLQASNPAGLCIPWVFVCPENPSRRANTTERNNVTNRTWIRRDAKLVPIAFMGSHVADRRNTRAGEFPEWKRGLDGGHREYITILFS